MEIHNNAFSEEMINNPEVEKADKEAITDWLEMSNKYKELLADMQLQYPHIQL